ncbi:Fur family transcriptional regulator [Sphingomonas sp. Marseille-Q8236]
MTHDGKVAPRRRCGEIEALVHGILAEGGRPLSAYDIAARASERVNPIVPAQVYRTLARLVRQRLVLRVEMLRAYVVCSRPIDLCLVCLSCHHVQLIEHGAMRSIQAQAVQRGFVLAAAPLEAAGLCDACAGHASASSARNMAATGYGHA